ncbi:MAG: hypothetical protein IPM39_26070 [Chloroflexi bacterium]|nr:hypothetical protein [Chloroflexota bacterium]
MSVYNPGPGAVLLPGEYIQIPSEGGDAYGSGLGSGLMSGFASERLLEAGETAQASLSFPHPGPETPLVVQIGRWLWGARGEGGG